MNTLSIRTKLALTISALVVIVMAVLCVMGYRYFCNELKTSIAKHNLVMVEIVAKQLDDQVRRSQEMLTHIAREIDQSSFPDSDYLQQFLDQEQDARTFFNGGFLVIDTMGRIVTESPAHPERRGMSLKMRDYVSNTLATGKPHISSPYLGSLDPHEPTITFTAPLLDARGKLFGMLAGRHILNKPNYIADIGKIKLGASGYLYLYTKERELIAHPHQSRILEVIAPGRNKAIDRSMGILEESLENTNSKGIPGITSYKRLAAAPWILAGHYPLTEAYEPIHRLRMAVIVIVVIILTLSLFTIRTLVGRISKPLVLLAEHARSLCDLPGNLREFPVTSTDEIGNLAASFNQMVGQLAEKQQELINEVAETRRAEESVRLFSQAVEQSASTIVITDTDGIIRYVNKAFTDVTGYTRDEAIGKNPRILKSGNQPPLMYDELWKTITAGKQWRGEFHNKRKDGTLFWELVTISPVFDHNGAISHYLAVKEDITTRKEQEVTLKRQQEELLLHHEELKLSHELMLQQEKMASIGRLAAGISHDFNNIMTGILGYVNLESMRHSKNMPTDHNLVAIRTLAEKAAQLTKGLLSFSRSAPMDLQSDELNGIVTDSLTILKRLVRDNIVIVDNLTSSPLPVMADRSYVEEALLNIVNNSCDAMPNGGVIAVTTALREITDARLLEKFELKAGEYGEIACHDSGKGIPAKLSSMLFEPFFTTKEVGKGIGLGLSIVYGIMKSHGGAVIVDSQTVTGTSVRLLFPLRAAASSATEQNNPNVMCRGDETILVTDDDHKVRSVVKYTLSEFGYTVLEAENGPGAIELLRTHGEKINLALLNEVMPLMDGTETYSAITASWPEIPTIIMSGNGETSTRAYRRGALISKPIRPMELLYAIREVIDS